MQKFKLNINLRQLFRIVIYNCIFILILYFAYTRIDWDSLSLKDIRLNIFYIPIAIIFFTAFYLCLAFGWKNILKLYFPVENQPTHLTYLGSQMFKYLPSSVFVFSSQALLTKNMGYGLKKVSKAILLQFAFILYTGITSYTLFSEYVVLGIIMCLFLFGSLGLVGYGLINPVRIPILGQIFKFDHSQPARLLRIGLFYLLSWLPGGLALYFLSIGLGYEQNVIDVIATQSISTFASILAVFAPGGIGVREYFFTVAGININIIVIWRIFTTIYDISLSVISLRIIKKVIRK